MAHSKNHSQVETVSKSYTKCRHSKKARNRKEKETNTGTQEKILFLANHQVQNLQMDNGSEWARFFQGNFHEDIDIFNQKPTEWLVEYNFNRPHQSLAYLTPIEYTQKHTKLLPMYPSSTRRTLYFF